MGAIDVVQSGMNAWSAADWAMLSSLLTDDFQLGSGNDPDDPPLGKAGFIAFGQAALTAFPDWDFNASDFREEGDKVYVTSSITGTHKGTLALIPGVAPVLATGKSITLPVEHHIYTIRGDQVSQIVIPDGRPVTEFYDQVGAPIS